VSKPGTINIHGNEYKTVALRVHELRAEKPDWSLITELITDEFYVVFKATLFDENDRVISTGHAEEARDKDATNRDSALEVCETSAVGRCLAFASWPGSELEFDPNIASADEVGGAIRKQIEREAGDYMLAVDEHWTSVVFIKRFLAGDDETDSNPEAALEAWRELGHEQMERLWKAPTKGGIFTIEERKQLNAASEQEATNRRLEKEAKTGEENG